MVRSDGNNAVSPPRFVQKRRFPLLKLKRHIGGDRYSKSSFSITYVKLNSIFQEIALIIYWKYNFKNGYRKLKVREIKSFPIIYLEQHYNKMTTEPKMIKER